ncbi:TetR/AcrR family transcriptional regulator [Endozoicomonas numazuensis]|uniref:TetR/AcrR family transcriptional regulator n=1 Tax=Endozoicomonas numazuensis TaxID=1137799 RepID=UPI0006912697|nr:TetR family transcriptional regulator [Endozoicomonas numazuensis]
MQDSRKPYSRKLPTQLRSKRIVEAIIQACRKILREEGPEALNTNYIAEVAGVNIASLYRWFDNKESVVAHTFEVMVADEIEGLMPLFDELNHQVKPDEAITVIIDILLTAQRRFLALHRYFYQAHQADFYVGSRPFIDGNQSWMQAASGWISIMIKESHPEWSQGDCDFKAFIITRAIEGIMLSAVTDNPDILDQDFFRDELISLARLYLLQNDHQTPT